MKNKHYILLIGTFLCASFVGAQTCSKTVLTEEKPCTEKLAGYVWNNEVEAIKALVEQNEKIVNIRLNNEETMLTLACWNGNLELVNYLISKNANVNCRNDWQNTPLHNAAQKGYNEIIDLLLQHGAVLEARGTAGNTALGFAAENTLPETVALLLKKGAKTNVINDYAQTPLKMASWRGNEQIISMLLEHGADVNLASTDWPVMHSLAYGGHVNAMKLVMDAGADINRVNNSGQTALHQAVLNNKPEAVALLAEKAQIINNQENNLGNTALHIAVINGDLKSTEILIKAGALTNIRNKTQKTPLDYAIQYGQIPIVEYLASKSLATGKDVQIAKANKATGIEKVNNESAKITYCGHAGWAVQTKNNVMIFDYWKNGHSQQGGLANGVINPIELKDKNVIVFVSHDHSDHYDSTIYQWKNVIKNISFVYGFKAEESWVHQNNKYHGPAYVYINDDQTTKVGNATITTIKSTDSGQGFLVSVDGVTIFHAGDHALFAAQDEAPFKKEIDFLAGKGAQVDFAFLPVTGCPSRWSKEFVVDGFLYTLDKLNPVQVFPMHAYQHEYDAFEFVELSRKHNSDNQIVCTENSGDSFQYTKTMVASK